MKSPVVTPQSPYHCNCLWCGQAFAASSSQARYCSSAHKKAHYRWRSKIGSYGREALVRIENLDSYMGRGDENEVSAIRQLLSIQKAITQTLKKAKRKDF